jgi:predicted DNA-binding protein YlxM (UPF0122 family)
LKCKTFCDLEEKSSDEKFGVITDSLSERFFLQLQPSVIFDFRTTPFYKDESFLRENYLEKGLNISELAELCFSSRAAVRNSLKRFGIPIKTQDQLLKTHQRLKYGEMRRKREIVANQRELQAIEKMKALRGQGFSYWKIADVLNAMGVRTKTGRGKWQARSVQKTLTGK